MLRLFLLIVLLTALSKAQGADEITTAPRGTFQLIQHYDGDWTQVLRFTHAPPRTVTLERQVGWPALYYVSPDDQWVLCIQKTGSGDNSAWIYHLRAHHHVQRLSGDLVDLGTNALAPLTKWPDDPYHVGIEFGSWDMKARVLHFTIHSSGTGLGGHRFERPLTYHLGSQTVTARKQA